MADLFPDLNSTDQQQIARWLLAIKPGHGDVINDRCVSHEHNGSFYVEGHRKPLAWNSAAQKLARVKVKAV